MPEPADSLLSASFPSPGTRPDEVAFMWIRRLLRPMPSIEKFTPSIATMLPCAVGERQVVLLDRGPHCSLRRVWLFDVRAYQAVRLMVHQAAAFEGRPTSDNNS
jgi:hypothetical protein